MPGADDRERRGVRGGGEPPIGSGPARRAARARARRRVVRRRRTLALLVLVAAVAVPMAAFGGSAPPRPPVPRTGAKAAASTLAPASAGGASGTATTATRTASTRTTVARATTPSPGTLPQTQAYPSGTSAQFRSLMAALWDGVVHDSLSRALPAFFPQPAYVQLKAIGDPAADWQDRLVHDFTLDLAAAHDLLGSGAPTAHLMVVDVVSSYGHWIPPGVCYNSIGYYEMPNARVVYREDGQVRSFGIASMISWRGVWYVVHFGAILRATDTGQVDDASAGPGVSAYSGTC